MATIESLDSRYTKLVNDIKILKSYEERIHIEQNSFDNVRVKIEKTLEYIHNLMEEMDCTDYSVIIDSYKMGKEYLTCLEYIQAYKELLLDSKMINHSSVMRQMEKVVETQKRYETLRNQFKEKYNYYVDSENTLNAIIAVCVNNSVPLVQRTVEELKAETKTIMSNEFSFKLYKTDSYNHTEMLPKKMFVARYPVKEISTPIMAAVGMTQLYQDISIDLINQGNVVIKCEFNHMEDEAIDSFVLAYIFRYIESFPLGTVNVHIFDRNASYLYKRLCNSFQTEKSGDRAKRTVQIFRDLTDLSVFRDVICEDIFRKISDVCPDLYSIYEHDKTDAFNLIVLRDGIIDGNGYVSPEILEEVKILTKPGDIGHRCGLRFLMIDSSSSFERNLPPNAKYQIDQIQRNCATQIGYMDGKFVFNGNVAEVLQIADDLDSFIQERSNAIAEMLNNKEQNCVSLDEISAVDVEKNPGSILYIPVGKTGGAVAELPISCKDENGIVAGQCVGYMAIGQSGSGKSSFFHSLVINGCIKYSPKDLQFWLLDFKNGGASSKYRNSGLPHIRMIAENNKIDDALCLFQMILEEMERRSNIFNKYFTDNIVDYNKIAIEEGLEYIPRIIVAIDEVQEIFRDDNASVL